MATMAKRIEQLDSISGCTVVPWCPGDGIARYYFHSEAPEGASPSHTEIICAMGFREASTVARTIRNFRLLTRAVNDR